MTLRVLIAAGGTGGHVYPAMAAAEALVKHRPAEDRLMFIGSVGGFERPLVEQANLPFVSYDEVLGGPVAGVNPLHACVSAVKLIAGTVQSFVLILRRKPQTLLLTGGWMGLPVALAAWVLRVPSLIYLPDVEPGSTIRLLARFVRRVAITTPASEVYFRKGQTVLTGYPLRQSLLEIADDVNARQRAVAHFGLDLARKTLLVFGGSRGARSINSALLAILPQLLDDGIQVIHVTGTLDWERIQVEKTGLKDAAHYHVYPYLHEEMGLAFAAADLVMCRAGASVLGELPLFGLPSILVPYPHAWRYQKVNADFLTERGAAIRMDDETMANALLPALQDLFRDTARLSSMSAAAKALAQPDGAWRIGQELIRLGENGA
jgi:UDP-N-acetylglucosamine--N-acetylmuramyl-(pentapeptide) pyrophosphoryl-undecaprenol N-acetylglucosamine transferase